MESSYSPLYEGAIYEYTYTVYLSSLILGYDLILLK